MHPLREALIHLYRWATYRQRAALERSFRMRHAYPAGVLFYHRVADQNPNEWTISTKNFVQHLDWLSQRVQFVSFKTICASQRSGERKLPMAHITFDDGYADNCRRAIPELVRRKIPTTYFVSTHFVESGESFPHDVRRGVPLRPNTIEEIRSMAADGITIGAHSDTHIDFGQEHSEAVLRREITDVRKRLQDWSGQSVDYFAFPYGLAKNISRAAIEVVWESGFEAFTSAAGGFNHVGGDSMHIQRIHGDPGMAQLCNWFTYDPRKTMRSISLQEDSKDCLSVETALSELVEATHQEVLRAIQPSRDSQNILH